LFKVYGAPDAFFSVVVPILLASMLTVFFFFFSAFSSLLGVREDQLFYVLSY